MRQFLSTLLITLILFYLETLSLDNCLKLDNVTHYCHIKNHLIENRIWYAIGFLLAFAIYNFYFVYRSESKVKNNVNDFLDQFFEDNLSRDNSNHRLTVFQTNYGARFFVRYIFHTIARFQYYKKCNKIGYRLKKTPIPWVKYLTIHSRHGMPNQNYRATIFKLSKDEKNTDSFAEFAYHTGQIEHQALPNIYDLDFKNICNLEDISVERKKTLVKNYMKKSRIRTFDSLRMFSRRTPYIAAIPLFTKKRSMFYPSHIIMYDSITLPYKDIEEEMKTLSQYIQIILINS